MYAKSLLQMSGVVVDLIYQVETVPLAGQEAEVTESNIVAGGGFNAMIAAKRSNMSVSYGGAHGTGIFSDIVRQALGDENFPILQTQSTISDQGNCVVLVDANGERTFVYKEGADGVLTSEMVSAVSPVNFDWVLLSGYGLLYEGSRVALDEWLCDLPDDSNFVFDPSPVVSRIPKPILDQALAKATWVSMNAEEANFLTGISNPEKAAEILASANNANLHGVIVRCGADGCWLALPRQNSIYVPGYSVDTIDTNGAGDAHVGSFIAALSQGSNPINAATYANAVAALSTTIAGAATAPAQQETHAFLKKAKAS